MRHSYFYLKLETHELAMNYKNDKRRIRVLLPKNYGKEKNRHYPVVYMHDGQNVFTAVKPIAVIHGRLSLQ